MKYDICMAATTRTEQARVLLTVNTPEAAETIKSAVRDAQSAGDLFQEEGNVCFVRATDRDPVATVVEAAAVEPPAAPVDELAVEEGSTWGEVEG